MSLLVTVAELQESARVLTDIPAFTTDTHVTTAMALDFVKKSAQKLAGLIQEAGADEQYLTLSTTLSTTAGIPTVSLPANTMDVIRLAMVVGGDREVQMSIAPLDWWDPGPAFWIEPENVPMYRVIGNTVTLFPTPTSVRTIRAYYTVGFTVVTTADILALRNNWDEFIVQDVCVRIRNRQNKDASAERAERAEAEAAIRRQLPRDRAGVRQIRDVRDVPYDGRRRPGWWIP
jgi:hypothetical protein